MRTAESTLRPWVIRHLKSRDFNGLPRRQRLAGRAILSDNADGDERGIEVGGEALLPFLLAARATACMPEARPVFAEGLASSYEAFLHTRKASVESIDDDDDDKPTAVTCDAVANWYLERLEDALPLNDHHASAEHPKIAATAERVLELWRRGEKVVVFCHYVQTGRVLRQVISGLMMEKIYRAGEEKLGCALNEVEEELERLGQRFFDADSPVRRACDAQVAAAIARYPILAPHTAELQETTRRYLRTPSFLVRFFPLSPGRLKEHAVRRAFTSSDSSGLSLQDVLEEFFAFLADRCIEKERADYLDAIRKIQTGAITGRDAQDAFEVDERQGAAPERLLANVRLVNGAVKSETRQRLMLTFNSPFFPEVLIASSVMAEGVDLHRFCRYVIHHDLCWNPSTLEQRTGRVDRIGAKVERCGQPICVYLPYLAETQDEKQYRVVMDRERWFNVVMGEKFNVDARSTEQLAQRALLPATLVRELTLRLGVA
jgi:ERCC4-related helicase